MEVLLKVGSGCSLLKSQNSRGQVGRREKFALFWMLANGERADLCPKADSPTDCQWARALKGEFQAHIDRGKGHMQKQYSQLSESS